MPGTQNQFFYTKITKKYGEVAFAKILLIFQQYPGVGTNY